MSTARCPNRLVRIIIATMMIAGASVVFSAEEPPTTPPTPSKETRDKMATLHEKMAACLRSDKAFAECRTEMQKNCQSMMGEQGCPMGMGMHDQMMKRPPPEKPDAK